MSGHVLLLLLLIAILAVYASRGRRLHGVDAGGMRCAARCSD